jgi:hypothetical protein
MDVGWGQHARGRPTSIVCADGPAEHSDSEASKATQKFSKTAKAYSEP